jgi:predicted nucleic acid-binding protein
MIVVCDCSPVIALGICNRLDLLERLFETVLIPKRVFMELTVPGKPVAGKIVAWAQAKVVEAKAEHLIQAYNRTLDAGEAEALSLYWEKEADFLLIDEKKGRKVAIANGVKVIGTLGILLLSKQQGFLNAIKPMMDLLQQSGIRISEELYRTTLQLAGETK